MKHLLFILIATVCLTACRSAKNASKSPVPDASENAGTQHTLNPSKGTTATAYVQQVIQQCNSHAKPCVTANVKVALRGLGKELSVNGALRMKRDDVIRLSLRFLGMEVGIMEFTPQDVLLVDRFHKQYVRASYHEVSFLKQANLDFYALQSLFWNELFVPGTRDVKSCMNRFNLFKANGYTILSPTNTPKLTYSFLTHANRALIEQVRVQGRKATDKGEFCWTYANFSAFGTRQFPHSMEMNVTGTGRDIKLSLDLSAISADSNWNTRTTISSKYQRRTVDEVLGGLKL